MAIARFLACKAGIYGTDDVERANIDAIVDYVGDYNNSRDLRYKLTNWLES